MNHDKLDVKYVAIYLRKSRGDEDKDLDKHRDELVNLCLKNDWMYTEYAEIGTGDSIAARPKMQQLLSDVEAETYDAVLVIHYDRLGRGDKVDQARIEKTFAHSNTLIITPQKVFDLNDESDMMLADFQGMIARQEYKAISRRMRGGKRRGALAGNWSNGTPPFPYKYNRLTKKAEPDEEKIPIYNLMKERILNGYTSTDVAWELNKMGIPSPRGVLWNPAVVRNIVCDETHLGKIVVGKKVKHPNFGTIIYKPKDEWVVVNNCHQAVKTQREHDKIMFIISRERTTPLAGRAGKSPFSGLIRCAFCGNTLQIQKRPERPFDLLKSCKHRDHWGNRCINVGASMEIIIDNVTAAIELKEKELKEAIEKGITLEDIRALLEMSEKKVEEIREQEKALERIYIAYEKGVYSDEVFTERLDKAKAVLHQLETEYEIIQKQADNSQNARNEDMLASVKEVKDILAESDDPKEVNRAYKSIIHSIEWKRETIDSTPVVKVNFL